MRTPPPRRASPASVMPSRLRSTPLAGPRYGSGVHAAIAPTRDGHVGGSRGSWRHNQTAVTDGRGGATYCAQVTALRYRVPLDADQLRQAYLDDMRSRVLRACSPRVASRREGRRGSRARMGAGLADRLMRARQGLICCAFIRRWKRPPWPSGLGVIASGTPRTAPAVRTVWRADARQPAS